MGVTQRRERFAPAGGFKIEARLGNAKADMREAHAWKWLSADQALAIFRGDGKGEFEIFAVAERMIERRDAVVDRLSGFADGDAFGKEDEAVAGFLGDVTDVGGEAIADVDHGMRSRMVLQ